MVQMKTGAALKDPPPSKGKTADPVSFFTYEGPKIGFDASIGASKNMKVLGFQATTKINHDQSISWGIASLDVKGPLLVELAIKGARKTVKMDLASTLEIAPVALFHKIKDRLAARGVASEQNGGDDQEDIANVQARVTEVESNGNKNENNIDVTANVTATE